MGVVTAFSVLTTPSPDHGTNNDIRLRFYPGFSLLSKENILLYDRRIYSLSDDADIKNNDEKKPELGLAFNLNIEYFTL